MYPPSPAVHLNLEALSGICGSISIACWVVVFSPQIIENFRRGSAEGLSLLFLVVWLIGDVFNIIGAVMQGVLPTMIILAIYYALADIVLLGQCFYYRGFTLSDNVQGLPSDIGPGSSSAIEPMAQTDEVGQSSERTPLIRDRDEVNSADHRDQQNGLRRSSYASITSVRERFMHYDSSHLSPAMPLRRETGPIRTRPPSIVQAILFNTFSVALVCAAGVLGWYISFRSTQHGDDHNAPGEDGGKGLVFNTIGQIFGYLCAAFYLGSRVPQLLLNWRRKSTEGVSFLFFLFACIGNLTYVLSIFAYSPICQRVDGRCHAGEQRRTYSRHLAVNASWLLGSLGTLFLDLGIFAQFILYREQQQYAADPVDESG
ncbi:hypothetical protein FQN57_007244 [Myotisia sp. PD_48]|nr:hypothetical protein FQN57_007244 [Myotisia sp. PD_48]